MPKLVFICLSFALFIAPRISWAEGLLPKSFGNGILNIVDQDSTWSMNFSARAQFLSAVTWNHPDLGSDNFQSNSEIRRARLKFSGFAYNPKLTYNLQFGFSNSDMLGTSEYTGNSPNIIYDAFATWNFYKNLELRVGQFKLPGNVERMLSSGEMQFVDRSIMNNQFNIDRDIGFYLAHHFTLGNKFLVRDIWALTQGEGRCVTTGNIGGYNYTSRIECLPWGAFINNGEYEGSTLIKEESPKLMLGATYNFNHNTVRTQGQIGEFMETDQGLHDSNMTNVLIDAVFKYKSLALCAEYGFRSASDPIAINSDGSRTGDIVPEGWGFNLQAGYLFSSNWEISTRISENHLNTDLFPEAARKLTTVALSKYIVGHKLKWQVDLSRLRYLEDTTGFLARVQLELHF